MSPRARARALVALAAVLAAGLVVGATIVQRRVEGEPGPATSTVRVALARPLFYPDFGLPPGLAGRPPAEQFAVLQRRGERGNVEALLLLGAAYQRAGQPSPARETFDRALAAAPADLRAQVAAAVGRFTRSDPSAAFSRLGPLARDHPNAAIVRFHLGVLLLWIGQADEARTQFRRAAESDPAGFYGREASTLLSRL
jgi:Tfp pilus assembly protein PilF